MDNLRPINGKVLFKVANVKATSSGILLATPREKKKDKGIIVAIADDVNKVKVGETILVDKYAATLLEETEDNNFYLCSEDDIYGVIEG